MTYKTILTVLDHEKSARQLTAFSMAFGSQFGAHVIGLHSEALSTLPLVAPMEIPDPVALEAMQEMANRETLAIANCFNEAARVEGVSAEWRNIVTALGVSGSFIDSARTADLILAAQSEQGAASDNRSELETALYESGRPVLLVPYILKEPKPIRRVMIAWNGSREAARATFDALPFLKQAESVEVFCVVSDRNRQMDKTVAGADIAETLARHGVKVTVVNKGLSELDAAAHIENRLSDASIDLLVMGAYSQKRWWEALFGGVTRTLLDSMTALTFLSR
ncbi:universal stress protein [Allorhizobium sp. BGMRC 0089]|uniref:universal stress protein n=1 Tax=Allorhizobium sonneratiae TaxID=2934936 RepID=UPI0020334C5B|nr:universal stress protein [Allorhizobium sonneratiae]MCM2293773.1 universal stress protein [Allorhizobium sonneratiae]